MLKQVLKSAKALFFFCSSKKNFLLKHIFFSAKAQFWNMLFGFVSERFFALLRMTDGFLDCLPYRVPSFVLLTIVRKQAEVALLAMTEYKNNNKLNNIYPLCYFVTSPPMEIEKKSGQFEDNFKKVFMFLS